jgi:hypothetical protein
VGPTDRFNRFLETIADRIEAGKYFYLYCLLMLFLIVSALHAASKALWYDELLTFYMSHVHGLPALWTGLRQVADLNPPLMYVATGLSFRLFGEGPIATRLPEIVGLLVMSVCLFTFVSRRTNGLYGLVAALFPWVTGAARYAYEARPYGMVLGFATWSLVCWQRAREGRHRRWALIGLTLGIAGAMMSHCYAVLVVAALGIGELVHTIRDRRIDWPVWLSLAIPLPLALTYLPLMQANARFTLHNAKFAPRSSSLWEFGMLILGPGVLALLAAFVVVLLPTRRDPEAAVSPRIPAHEWAAAAILASTPIIVLALAFITRMFQARYGLPSVLGLAILFTFLAYHRTLNRRVSGVLLMTVLLGGFLFNSFSATPDGTTQSLATRGLEPDQLVKDLPLVIGNGTLFMQVDHYATPELASRLYLLRDSNASLRYTGTNMFDDVYPAMKRWYPIRGRIEDYNSFIRQHDHFMVFGPMHDPLDWLIFKLVDDDAQMDFRGQFGDGLLFEVHPKTHSPPET